MIHFKKRFSFHDICFFISIAAALPFLIWKCHYGYGANDEPFYLTLAQRLANGDALLSEEWNLSQLSGLILLPFYRLHNLFTGSTEGIVLHFRYIYVVVQTLVCIGLYLKLRRFRLGAVAAILLFYLYTPYDVMALSYNTMGLMCMALCLSLLACNETHKHSTCLFSGFFYALAVLCNPYLISIYVLYVLLYAIHCLICTLTHRKQTSRRKQLYSLLFFTIGAALIALFLLLFTLSRTGLSEIFTNLSEILNDPDHASRPLHWVVYSYLHVIWNDFGSFLTVWAVILLLAFMDRRRTKNAWMYFCMTALVTAIAVLMHIPSIQTDYNYIMFPVSLCGLTAYLLTNRKNHRTFFWLWFTGIFYTFCLSWASNQGLNSICMGMPVVLLASILLIYDLVIEIQAHAKQAVSETATQSVPASFSNQKYPAWLTVGIVTLLFLAQLGTECYAKSMHAFWEPSVSELTVTISAGPLKGVRTTQEHASDYEVLLHDIAIYAESDDPVLFIVSAPWCYLYADREYGTYSSWLSSLSTTDPEASRIRLSERLGRYYELHPDKLPTQIYIAKNDLWTKLDVFENMIYTPFTAVPSFSSHLDVYSVTESEHGYHLTLIP